MKIQPTIDIKSELSKEKEYKVLAILSGGGNISEYLILNDSGNVVLYSIDNFNVISNEIPKHWKINYSAKDYRNDHISLNNVLIIGYPELIDISTHLVNIIDNPSPEDIQILSKYI